MSEEDKTEQFIDDLKHKVLEQKLQGVKGQVMSLADTMHERMNSIETKNDTGFSHLREILEDIKETGEEALEQAKATNGRVTSLEGKMEKVEEKTNEEIPNNIQVLEKDTKVVRFMHKYPTVTIILLVVGYLMTIIEIRTVVFEQVGEFFKFVGRIM
jgi:predicted nucleotide-binding protein (sugar kinase/HSP70/actin superfamily)